MTPLALALDFWLLLLTLLHAPAWTLLWLVAAAAGAGWLMRRKG